MVPKMKVNDGCACIREDIVAHGVEDADHDHVAAGADHDGADDEGADARLVEADFAGGRLVEGSYALRCVRCGIAL
eukprot:383945-Prymnesium_polylepis.1